MDGRGWWAGVLGILVGCGSAATSSEPTEAPSAPPPCGTGELDDGEVCVPERCGRGPWGDLTGDVWVDAAAPEGGDGSADRPLRTVQEGADAAAERGGGIVALAGGTYPGPVALTAAHDGVDLRGRCPEQVLLDGTGSADDYPAVALEGNRRTAAALSGVTLAHAPLIGVGVLAGTLDLTEVIVTDAGYAGLYVQGADATAQGSDLRIEDPRPIEGYASGFGVEVRDGATLGIDGLEVRGASSAAVNVHEAAEASLEACTLSDTLAEPGARGGWSRGVLAREGSRVQLTGCTVAGAVGYGVAATDSGSQVIVADLRVTGIVRGPDGGAAAIGAAEGARIDGSEVTVEGVEGSALWAVGGVVDLAAVTVRDVADGTEAPGTGAFAGGGGTVTLEGLDITTCQSAALWSDAGGDILARDVHLADIGLDATGDSHVAIAAAGGMLEIDGGTVDAGPWPAVVSDGEGSWIHLDGVVVGAPWAPASETGVIPLAAELGGTLEASDVQVTGGWGAGVQVNGGLLVVDGLEISGIQPLDGDYGFGLSVVGGGEVRGTGLVITDVYAAGISATDAEIDLSALEVYAVHDPGAARAVDLERATVRLDGVLLHDLDGFGIVASGGSLTLLDAEIRGLGRPTDTTASLGIAAQSGGEVEAQDLSVTGVAGPGIQVYQATLDCADCRLEDNGFAGLVLIDAAAQLSGGSLAGNVPDPSLGGGLGAYLLRVSAPTTLGLAGVTVGPHAYAGIWVDGGALTTDTTDLSGGPGIDLGLPEPLHGNALYVGNLGTASLTGGRVHDAGIAVLLDDADASFTGVGWSDNAVDIQQQRCGEVPPVDPGSAPAVVVCPRTDTLTVPIVYTMNFVDAVATDG